MRVWNRATGEPWAITEQALSTILEIAARENESPKAVAARLGRELSNTYTAEERDGVAIIPVVGPLFRYANLFTAISGASSYEILAKDFTAALENPDIHAVVLDIDSPGGEVNGCAEFANMIFEARGMKPVIAYCSGDAASGAYWIASSCDQVVVSETSSLGSIGVVAVYRAKDRSAKDVEIVSSQSPYKRLDPESDEGRLRLQQRIDAMAEVFVGAVARNRGVDPPTVKDKFGKGDAFIGVHAVAAGLADRLGSLEKVIAGLNQQLPDPAAQRGFSISEEEPRMDLETLQTEHPELAQAMLVEGRNQERARIAAILESDAAQGWRPLAQHLAFHTEMEPEAVQAALATAPQVDSTPTGSLPEQASGFDQVMRALGNPDVAPDPDDTTDDYDAVAQRIAAHSRGGQS